MQNSKKNAALARAGGVSRRRFVQGIAVGGALAGLGILERPIWALTPQSGRQELGGTDFELTIDETPVNFTGKSGIATAVNGQVPAPLLRWREGDTVTLKVTNRLKVPASIHWHGIILPNPMDGVPGMTFAGIAPGASFTYRFPVRQSGTYWYHSHSGFQEQTGLYGPIIIEPRHPAPFRHDREHVVMLSDWTDDSPGFVYSRLKKADGYYNYAQPTLGDFIAQARKEGLSDALAFRGMWDRMRMSPRDLADVSAATYTFLMNGTAPAGNWNALFRPGEKVLLRFINGSAMSYFDVRIPGLKMTVVAADGQYVHPISVDEFRIGVAETYDVLVEPQDERAYTLFAQSVDRSGYARGTLAPRAGMSAPVPAMDPIPTLTMADMGMAMDDMAGMEMSGDTMQGMEMPADGAADSSMAMPEHGGHEGMAMSGTADTAAMDKPTGSGAMNGMNMSGGNNEAMGGMDMAGGNAGTMDNMSTAGSKGSTMSGMDMGGTAMTGTAAATASHTGMTGMDNQQAAMGDMAMGPTASNGMMKVTRHPATESGPGAGMQASEVSTRLDDPGVGLRHNGRRVLTYADLRGIGGWLDARHPTRTIELHLTGNMERYMWSFDGVKFSDAEPIRLRRGEVVRVVLVNDTMMEHPIHLHGMWSELEAPDGGFQVRKHTVSVKPGHAVTYRVLADAEGRWAYHCHLLYHMKAGMFREVQVV